MSRTGFACGGLVAAGYFGILVDGNEGPINQ